MISRLEDAVLVLRKWVEESATLLCTARAPGFRLAFAGSISTLDLDGFRFHSLDGKTELVLEFEFIEEITYDTHRDSASMDAKYDGLLVFILRLGEVDDSAHYVSLSEVKNK